MKKITFLFLFSILCFTVDAQVLTEGFEGGIPAGWTQTQLTGTNDWTTAANNQNSTIQPRTGAEMAYFFAANYTSRTRLETSSLDLTTLTTPVLTFYYTNVDWSGDIDELRVFYKNSAAGTWTQMAVYTATAGSWTEVNIVLPNPSDDYYIGFEGKANWGRGVTIDDVLVDEIGGCLPPGSLSVLPTSVTEAQLSWIAAGSEGDWSYEYGLTGFTLSTGAGGSVTSQSADISGLIPGETYDFYVQANCGDGDSDYAGPYTWTQPDTGEACGTAIVVALEADCGTATPVTLDFSATTTPGGGSCDTFLNIGYWLTTTTDASGGLTINASEPVDVAIFSDCTGSEEGCYGDGIDPSLNVVLSPNTQYYMYFWNEEGNTSLVDICISSYTPASAPDCAETPISPADSATDVLIPGNELTLTWTAPSTGPAPTDYEFFFGTTSGSLTSLGTVGGTDTSIDLINLDFNTTYYWQVVPINDVTPAAGPCAEWSFTTQMAPPAPECATAPITPLDGANDVPSYNTFDLSWTAPATGPTPTSYNIYVGELPDGSDQGFFANTTDTSFNVYVGAEFLTLYWSVRPLNDVTEATGCDLWSFTTGATPSAPSNDNLCNATMLTVDATSAGNAFYDINATAETGEVVGSCFDGGVNGSTWYTFIAPASGDVQVSTDIAGGTNGDTEIAVYEAPTDCNDASTIGTELGCDQDGGDLGDGFLSTIILTGLDPGATYYIQVDRWGTQDPGYFGVEVFDMQTLSNNDIQTDTDKLFTYYPNPVTDNLTLNAQKNIQNVEVFNMLGQRVLNSLPNSVESTVDMSNLKTGAYFVKVTIDNTTETIRVIKN